MGFDRNNRRSFVAALLRMTTVVLGGSVSLPRPAGIQLADSLVTRVHRYDENPEAVRGFLRVR
jgi:hypothetical protein